MIDAPLGHAPMLHVSLPAFVLAVLAVLVQGERRDEPRRGGSPQQAPQKVTSIRCTPSTISTGVGAPQPAKNPIAQALQRCAPGGLIELAPGDYPSFGVGFAKNAEWNANTSGGTRTMPIVVRALGEVRVLPGSGGDTIAITQQVRCGFITFEGLTIVCGYRAGVMFYKCGENELHEGFRFLDCNLEGGFDHLTGQGANSKWGMWGHSLKDFEFRGVRRRSYVRNTRHEHGFYLQNARGDITIENVDASRLGRTFVQFVARADWGPPGVGTILVRNCTVEDVGIARGDDYKGGSAFTLGGRHSGVAIFENNRFRAGFDQRLKSLTREGVPYGSGAFVAWDARGERNGTLILDGNDFEFAAGCGDRAVVSISGCKDVRIRGKNRFVSGGKTVALELDPPPGNGSASNPNLAVELSPDTLCKGGVRIAGTMADSERLAELAPKSDDKAKPDDKPKEGGR